MLRLSYKGNAYQVLLIRLIVALFFMSLTRLLFYLFNEQYFSDLSTGEVVLAFAGGIRFDITSLIVLNSVYIFMITLPLPFRSRKFWQLPANIIFYITNIIGFALNIIDTVYFRFTSKRMTADIFSFVKTGEDDFMTLLPRFIADFAWELLAWLILCAAFIWLASRFRMKPELLPKGLKYYLLNTALFLLTAAVSIIGIRGGFQLRPITIINAGDYTTAKNVSLVLNTPFSIIKSYGHTGLVEVHYFDDDDAPEEIFNPVYSPEKADTLSPFQAVNVIVIIMESFGTEYIGALNGIQGSMSYTPNLDSIIEGGKAYRAFANGKQSMEALPAILAGIPSLITRPYITSAYGSNNINSLANILKAEGYSSSFFHGGRNGTMGFESFTNIAGFDQYFGKDEYGNDADFDGNWGIYDGPFFDFFRAELDMMPQPFLASIFSLSSHHPYAVPDNMKGKFSKGTLDIHESIMYSDYVLGKFFRNAAGSDWFANTLFVITADHTSLSYEEEYRTRNGIYAVPVVFYMPGKINACLEADIAQHTDILPSVLGFMNYDKPFVSFGNDLFDTGSHRFSVNYLDGTYQLIKDGWSLHFDGKQATALYKLANADPVDQISTYPDIANELEHFLKAIIQEYNYRMLHNELTISPEDE